MTIKIEKNIPIPYRYPFKQMEVGDSFEVPEEVTRSAVSVAALRFGRRHGMIFSIRFTPEKKLRCWRVS